MIGDHIVCKNHHHALPLFVVDFERKVGDYRHQHSTDWRTSESLVPP